MPMLIEELKSHQDFQHLEDSSRNKELYLAFAKMEGVEDIGLFLSVPVQAGYRMIRINGRVNSGFEIALLHEESKSIVYYNKVNILHDVALTDSDNFRRATQVLLWRTSYYEHQDAIHKIPMSVFFDYLLKSFLIVVSDTQQTTDGSRFWGTCITRALKEELYVYHYNFMDGSIDRIADREHFESRRNEIWGSLEGHHDRQLAVISSISLPHKTA